MPQNYWDQFEEYKEPATNYWDQFEEYKDEEEDDSGWGSFGSGYGLPSLGDIGSTVVKGVTGLGDSLIGMGEMLYTPWRSMAPGTPSLQETLRDYVGYEPWRTRGFAESLESPEKRAAEEEYGRSEGFNDAMRAYWRNPGLALTTSVESIPQLVPSAILGATGPFGPVASAMIGEGATTAGSQASQIYQDTGKFDMSDWLYSAGSGAMTGALSGLGGKVASKFGLPDIDSILERRPRNIPALIGSGLNEAFLEELPQSVQEQVAINLAEGKPWDEGVPQAAVGGTISGGLMGGVLPAFRRSPSTPPLDDYTQQEFDFGPPDPIQEQLPFDPVQGPQSQPSKIWPGIDPRTGRFRKIYPEATQQGQLPFEPTTNEVGQIPLDFSDAGGPRAKPAPEPAGEALLRSPLEMIGDESGQSDFLQMWNTLKQLLGRDPSIPEVNEALAQEQQAPQEGEVQTPNPMSMGVARFPVSARQALQTILANPGNDPVVDSAANDFVMQVGRTEDTRELAQLLQSIPPIAEQDAVTRGLADVVRQRMQDIHRRNMEMAPPSALPPPMNQPGPSGRPRDPNETNPWEETPQEALAGGPNVAQFPARPTVGDRQVESFRKGMLGDVQTRAAQMQQRADELKQQYPSVPDEWIRRVITAENNIARHSQSPNVNTPFVQQMIADNQRRLELMTHRMQSYENAYAGGPTGIASRNPDLFTDDEARTLIDRAFPPPTPEPELPTEYGQNPLDEEALQYWRDQDRLIGENQAANGPLMEDEWGPITPGHAESLLPRPQLTEGGIEVPGGELLPAIPQQTEFERMMGLKPGEHMSDEQIEKFKRDWLANEQAMYGGVDQVEDQAREDEATGTIGDEKIQYGEMGLDEDDDVPRFAKVKGGGLAVDVNITRAATNLTKDYTSPLPAIMNREGVQNALDAIAKLGDSGKVTVRFSMRDGTMEIYDNGSGLDETGLSEKLVRLFASGKENEEGATGGKGIGSASYILGGQHFDIDTIAVDSQDGKKYRIYAGGTPDQFLDPTKGSDYERTEVPMETPTGTTIKVHFKPEQDGYDGRDMMMRIVQHSRDRNGTILVDNNGYTGKENMDEITAGTYVDEYNIPASTDDKLIGEFNINGSDITVAVAPHDPKVKRTFFQIHYLNNGMYQFSESRHFDSVTGMPEHVIVNIKPQMDEQDDGYPFINTREDIKKDMREQIGEFIDQNIKNPALNKKKNRTQELYDSMPHVSIPGTKRKTVIFDPGERLTKQETAMLINHPNIHALVRHWDQVIEEIIQSTGRTNWGDRLEGIGLVMDPGMHGVHIPNPATKKSTILINPFIRMENGATPADNAFDNMITAIHEAAHIGSESGWGTNPVPLTMDLSDPRYVKYYQSQMEQIRDHGDIGWHDTGHKVDFIQRLGEIYAKFGPVRTFQAADKLESIFRGAAQKGEYSPEFQKLLQLYTESRGRAETTEDLLSGTGVRQSNTRPTGEGNIPSNTGFSGTGVTSPIIDKFRRGLKTTDSYNDAHFILPDGTKLVGRSVHLAHEDIANSLGIGLDDALKAGIMRFNRGAASVSGPITKQQAQQLMDAHYYNERPPAVDVYLPNGEMVTQEFNEHANSTTILNWVNNQFSNKTPAQATVTPQTISKVVIDETKRLIKDETGTVSIPSWGNIKQATGIGMGQSKPVGHGPQYNALHETIMLPAGATTTLDMSAPGRQGLALIHTPQYWKALLQMPRGLLWSEFDKIDKQLRAKPIFQPIWNPLTKRYEPSVAEKAGLELMVPASSIAPGIRAQQIASKWLETGGFLGPEYIKGVKNPIRATYFHTIGYPVRASNRAFITFLNSLRANRFEYLMNRAQDVSDKGARTGRTRMPGIMGSIGLTQAVTKQEAANMDPYLNHELAKEIADFVNTATGAGPLKTHVLPFRQAELNLEKSASLLSAVFFSPGLMASRVRMLNPNTYVMASPTVRKEYMKSALATGMAWYAFTHMIKMAAEGLGLEDEVTVSDQLTSSDFGKVRIGDFRIDPGAGFQQFIVNMARTWHGGWTTAANQEFHNFGEGYRAETHRSNIERFLTNKLNPVVKFAYDLADADQYAPFHVYDRMAQLAIPLYLQDIYEIVKENPQLFPIAAPAAMIGMGTQMYGKGESEGKLVDPEYDWLVKGGGGIRNAMPWNWGKEDWEVTDFPFEDPDESFFDQFRGEE